MERLGKEGKPTPSTGGGHGLVRLALQRRGRNLGRGGLDLRDQITMSPPLPLNAKGKHGDGKPTFRQMSPACKCHFTQIRPVSGAWSRLTKIHHCRNIPNNHLEKEDSGTRATGGAWRPRPGPRQRPPRPAPRAPGPPAQHQPAAARGKDLTRGGPSSAPARRAYTAAEPPPPLRGLWSWCLSRPERRAAWTAAPAAPPIAAGLLRGPSQ